MLKNVALISILSLLPLSLAACDGAGGSAGSTAAAGSGKPAATAAAKGADQGAKDADDPPTEYDLSTAGDTWKGYVATLPRAGAKVMGDGSNGARLATGGREKNPFDVAWAPGKGNQADLKKGLEDANKQGNVKTEFVVDTADALEWVNTYEGGSKSYHFDINMKVGDADFHCYTLPMGTKDEAQYKKHKDACATLKKK